jgi:hypothetical protein
MKKQYRILVIKESFTPAYDGQSELILKDPQRTGARGNVAVAIFGTFPTEDSALIALENAHREGNLKGFSWESFTIVPVFTF